MHTYHIHIEGLVQGVGFRPYIYQVANALGLTGTVSNGPDGVHIYCTGEEKVIFDLLNQAIKTPPPNALIRTHSCTQKPLQQFSGFSIVASERGVKPDLLLTPDLAICSSCTAELHDPANRRFHYSFITCLQCGPRYSITTALPYDREFTTMVNLPLCPSCTKEYADVKDRRHYSQTNSCPVCAIPMKLYNQQGELIAVNPDSVFSLVQSALAQGHIVAVKGIGGYLLLCDATKKLSVLQLRERKHRPAKPFAVLYSNLSIAEQDILMSDAERNALTSKEAPIVLCKMREELLSGLCKESIAPGLSTLGVMLPYTGILDLIATTFEKPLVATSGNLSGSPIIYTDEDAICYLTDYADYVLSYDREIVMPQDDSVVRFTEAPVQRIVIRRSRGMAPNYFPSPYVKNLSALAMGAEMKSAFALADHGNLYVSQFLGDQSNYESEESFKNTLRHMMNLLQIQPAQLLVDLHPGYQCTKNGKQLAAEWKIPVQAIQHHKAHFGAVLAENKLMNCNDRILGVIWDGTGYGEDGQIWGGEFFILNKNVISRAAHLRYFPQLMGDKMSREPRLSALSLLHEAGSSIELLRDHFTTEERSFYQKMLHHPIAVQTSSMGRLLDGVAALLQIKSISSYEGEAAMLLESKAGKFTQHSWEGYPIQFEQGVADWRPLVRAILADLSAGASVEEIAYKVFVSLVKLIDTVADTLKTTQLAFSGGVFQNGLVVHLIKVRLGDKYKLYFHQQLSPNDECISVGQLAIHTLDSY